MYQSKDAKQKKPFGALEWLEVMPQIVEARGIT
jgi:hypothetical protein